MTGPNAAALERGSAVPQPDNLGLMDYARNAPTVVLASLAIAAGVVSAAIKGLADPSLAGAQAAAADIFNGHEPVAAEASRTGQVQEYAKVAAQTSTGATTPIKPNIFVLREQCKDGSKAVNRKVVVTRSVQPLGSCNIGSPVTVTDEKPRSSDWQNGKPTKERIPKATRKNNHHFVFTEQQIAETPVTPPASVAPAEPAPVPPLPPVTLPPTPVTPPVTKDPFASGNVGTDISWPQCNGSNNTVEGSVSNFSFGLVGIQDGLGYSVNPCLASEVADFTGNDFLYVNTGWYSGSAHVNPNSPNVCATGDEVCLAYNYGYNNALFAVQTAANEGISVTGMTVGEDLEESNTWSQGQPNSAQQNESSLQGTHDGLLASGVAKVLFYTNPSAETDIIANYQNGWPEWFASGATTAAEAAQYCTNGAGSVNGGPVEIVQFEGSTTTGTTGIPVDEDYVC
ncbi:MAG TPA: hypothetical protein VFC50_04070 [Candidatus Dormibacteraeota bacterium]|nr:hypothetical protein [Candidatus Dormibacteraeota bacterium]